MWVHLNNVHIHELLVWKSLSRDQISHVNDARFFRVCVVVKENMLGVVVRLINQQKFGMIILPTTGAPRGIVILDCHNRVFLQDFDYLSVDLQVVLGHDILIRVNHVNLVVSNALMIFSLHQNSIRDITTLAVHGSNLLVWIAESEILRAFSAVHLHDWHTVTSVEAWVLTLSEFVQLMHAVLQVLAEGSEYNGKLLLILL